MTSRKSDSLKTIERILEALSGLEDAEYEKILDDSYRLEVIVRKRVDRPSPVEEKHNVNSVAALEALARFPNRDEARLYLEREFPSKKDHELIARALDISVLKSDKVESLREKIVEATVGARIRSNAIQGKV